MKKVSKNKETFAPVCNRQGRKSSLCLKTYFRTRGAVKFYNPRRYSRDHRLPSLARAPWPPFYYYKKVRCMRRMCGRTGLSLLQDLVFTRSPKSGCRALGWNVPRMCANVPECVTNVRPNVQTQAGSSQNHIFHSEDSGSHRAMWSPKAVDVLSIRRCPECVRMCPSVPRMCHRMCQLGLSLDKT